MGRRRGEPPPDTRLSRYGQGLYRLSRSDMAILEALQPIRCQECNRTIQPGESFSRIRIAESQCQACRPFEILLEDADDARGEAVACAGAAYEHVWQEIASPRCTDAETAQILLDLIREGRAVLARIEELERLAKLPLEIRA
jgi:hypothetical protein